MTLQTDQPVNLMEVVFPKQLGLDARLSIFDLEFIFYGMYSDSEVYRSAGGQRDPMNRFKHMFRETNFLTF